MSSLNKDEAQGDGAQGVGRMPEDVLHLKAGTRHVVFGALAHIIADALFPEQGDHDERWRYAGARVTLDTELRDAVRGGKLQVRDALTLGPHSMPFGRQLQQALVSIDDLRAWLKSRGMRVVVLDEQQAPGAVPAGAAQAAPPANASPVLQPEGHARNEREEQPESAGPAPAKKWTVQRLAELAACRKAHGTKAAAERFVISAARVRELLPSEKPARAQKTGYSVFTHRTK
ncbi:MAG: hypothetical protein IT500_10165 [Rubrivivax sp.]|nr:hypothetical protein [Rubrivivax sp.]